MAQEQAPPGGEYTAKKEPLPPGIFWGKDGRTVKKEGRLGSGVMGEVFLGRYQDNPDEFAAIKKAKWGESSPEKLNNAFRHEAAILKILTKRGVPHIPRLHHYEPGQAKSGIIQTQPYIVMDYAKGEMLDSFSFDSAFDEQTALEATKQISEGLQAAHQAGINCDDMKTPGGNTMWDPEAHQAVILDWGLAKSNVKSDNKYMAHWVAAVFPEQYVNRHKQEPLTSPVSKALLKLNGVLKAQELTAAKKGSAVVFEYTSADSASGDQIFELINRILANESSSGLYLDIDSLTKTKSFTINDDEPVDLDKLTTVEKIPGQLLGQNFLLANINSISPEQMPHYWGLKFSSWSSPYSEAKLSSLDQMKRMVEQDSIPQLVLPGKFILSVMKQFIKEGQSYLHHPIWSSVAREERDGAFQNMAILFQDIMLLTLRPDIATTGNRLRVKENLGKLGQLLDLSTLDNIEEIQKLTEAATPPSAEPIPELTLESLMENIRSHPQRDRLSALAALVKTQTPATPPETSASAEAPASIQRVATEPTSAASPVAPPPPEPPTPPEPQSADTDSVVVYNKPWQEVLGSGHSIGEGLSGQVFRLETNANVVVKVFNEGTEYFDQELHALQKLKDSNHAVRLLGYSTEHKYLVKEFVDGENMTFPLQLETTFPLKDVREISEPFKESAQRSARWIISCMEALAEIHDKGVIIGDFKIKDYLWESGSGKVVIIDFANAWDMDPKSKFYSETASPFGDINDILKVFFSRTKVGQELGAEIDSLAGTASWPAGFKPEHLREKANELGVSNSLKKIIDLYLDENTYPRKHHSTREYVEALRQYFEEVGIGINLF